MERLTIKELDYSKVGVVENIRTAVLAAAMCRLAAYEDAEEEGRLLVLPCKVGDVLWDTESLTESPSRHIVLGFDVLKSLNMVHLSGGQSLPVSEIGKTVFLTREEAEAALAKERDM